MIGFNKIPVIDSTYLNRLSMSETDLNLVIDGDSLTYGLGGNSNQDYSVYIENKISSRFSSFTMNSFGVSGQDTQDMIADASTQIDVLVDEEKYNVIIAWEDVNAILNNGRTAQQNYDDFITYFSTRKAAGFDKAVLILGYYPRLKLDDSYNQPTWNDTLFDIQEAYRELVRNATSPPWDVVVDLTIHPILGGDRGQYVNDLFYDSVHLSSEGYNAVGEWILQNGLLTNFR